MSEPAGPASAPAGPASAPGGPASGRSGAAVRHRAAVLGKPVAHSLSPLVHGTGYEAAGLDGWSYVAVECDEAGLAGLVAGLGEEWAGLSLTMPLKEVALAVADAVDPVAAALGAANTLVRGPDGWSATNTDAPGMLDALGEVGVAEADHVAVLGGGGTARAALYAAARLGARVSLYARRPATIEALRPVAAEFGVDLAGVDWSRVAGCVTADVIISTVPKGVADQLVGAAWRPGVVYFDVIYDSWPTPAAAAAARAGARVVSGLDLLLAQAVRQFELYTGVGAPVAAMRQALAAVSKAATGAM